MADTSFPARSSVLAPSAGEVVVGLLGAAMVSIAVNSLIALVAGKLVPEGAQRMGLALAEYAPATVIGILLGTLGWYLVRRFAKDPRKVLRVLVPVVVVVSWVPDLGILAGGATAVNSVALILMHTVVAVATVPVLSRVLPLAPGESSAPSTGEVVTRPGTTSERVTREQILRAPAVQRICRLPVVERVAAGARRLERTTRSGTRGR